MDWHRRYTQQARWTHPLREYLFRKTRLGTAGRVLEVGCGTGAILADITGTSRPIVYGLDLRLDTVEKATRNASSAVLVCADAHHLPYPTEKFDIAFCHFLLLWVSEPLTVLREMRRVTRTGGAILALAEPDYSRRSDAPQSLIPLGQWQTESLRKQGANPSIGGQLARLFAETGIRMIETGELARGEPVTCAADEWELEWDVLESDLAGLVPDENIRKYKEMDRAAWQAGTRVFHVPTHYAWGIK